ncbi:MAG TPA: hypothetical protein VFV07_08495 [Rhizomicrobium sp.]|nr:hypothetical protein [Rhizomicrobium sp.]
MIVAEQNKSELVLKVKPRLDLDKLAKIVGIGAAAVPVLKTLADALAWLWRVL